MIVGGRCAWNVVFRVTLRDALTGREKTRVNPRTRSTKIPCGKPPGVMALLRTIGTDLSRRGLRKLLG